MNQRLFLFFFFLAVLAWAGGAAVASVTVDLRSEGDAAALRGMGRACLRASMLPRGAAAVDELAVGDTLTFLLFRDTELCVRLAERMESPLGGEAFLGEAEGYDGVKNAVVLQSGEGLMVDIQDFENGRVWSIVSGENGVTVREIDPSAEPARSSAPVVPDWSAGEGEGASSARPRAAGDQPEATVDVLVAYDTPAAAWARQNGGGITNFANLAVQKMNTVLANNGMSEEFRFRLVGVMEVAANGGGDFDGVLAATRAGTGDWAAIKAWRDEVGADVVTTMIDSAGSGASQTGLGYSLEGEPVSDFSEWPYNVCAVRAVAQGHTMTHETGHNLGAGHATAVDPYEISAGPQLYSYSAGHYFTGTNGVAYHTIMGYNYDGFGNSYQPAPFFSSPDRIWMGTATGDATHDNERTLRQTHAAASQWRARKVPLSYDVFFEPAGGTVFTGSVTVALSPGKAGLPIRYTLDGSAPTLSSPLYDGPVTLTATTTIRAAAVTDGILGPVFEATYSLADLAVGLDAPQLEWRTNPDCPWTFVADETYDGVDAARSTDDGQYWSKSAWLDTSVEGPAAMTFRYKMRTGQGTFSVAVDDDVRFSDTRESVASDDWHLASVEIPSGTHAVRFLFAQEGSRYSDFNGAWLDTVALSQPSRAPTLSPATTEDLATALTFERSLTVTISPPEGAAGTIYYTLNGTAANPDTGLVYRGPIELSSTTRIRAIFVEDGMGPSAEVVGYYRESHPVGPGEWTTDVEGAKAAVARDGRLIAVLMASRATCWWSQRFYPVAESPEFLAWAQANGIYLVTGDTSCNEDAEDASDWFWQLHGYGSVSLPTLCFVRPAAPDEAIGMGLARNDGSSTVGTELYLDTAESLIAGFASVLGESAPKAPVCSVAGPLVSGFPLEVTLTNSNGAGSLLYTLDGSAPTRANGIVYAGPVVIPDAATVLRAAVWPGSGVSSPVFVGAFMTVADVLGTSGVEWTLSEDRGWREDDDSPGTLRAGGLMDGTYEATLRGTVQGKGKLSFDYAFNTWTWQNTFAFSVNGAKQWQYAYDGSSGFSGSFEVETEDEGATPFQWTYVVADASRDYGAGYSSEAGVWLRNVRWSPDAQGVRVEGVQVPFAWLDRHYPGQGGTAAAFDALARADSDGDGFPAWQEYLLESDPTNAASCLTATLRMDAGVPVLGWTPSNANIEALGYRYVPMGRVTMTDDAGWQPLTPSHTFFSIQVQPLP